ncbi:hypothetical protein LUZ61_007409 [Rhynchospora tenuis]|uniref:Uncharacterized protein n=1 Tax=Rhynchospora tenuis TaxID=198213 RepID=A0AAD6EWJ5_9POAL|nr:hypothetical protein LUZ61_007409 [Rhynchospora tenuis]
MDAWGKWKFKDSWAKTCCDGVVPSGLNLLHDQAVVKFPNIDLLTNKILMKVAPNLPKIDPISKDPSPNQKQLIHRSFTVDATTIQLLKQRAMQEIGATHNSSPPTTFAVLAAHIWIAIARARGITSNNDKPTFLISLLDGRPLLPPPMRPSYTGNCSFSYAVASSGTGLMCTNGLGRTCECIAETIRTTREDVKRGNVMDLDSLNGLKVFLVGSNRLDVYVIGLFRHFSKNNRVFLKKGNKF